MAPLNQGPKSPNLAQIKNQTQHISFLNVASLLADIVPNPSGGFGNSKISQAGVRNSTTSPDNTDPGDFMVLVNAGAATFNLPAATDGGRLLFIVNKGTSVAITPNGTDTINGAASLNLTNPNEYAVLLSDTVSNWAPLGHAVGAGLAVSGPPSVLDHEIARWDGTTGTLLEESNVFIDDTGNVTPASSDAQDLGSASVEWLHLWVEVIQSIAGMTIQATNGLNLQSSGGDVIVHTGTTPGNSFYIYNRNGDLEIHLGWDGNSGVWHFAKTFVGITGLGTGVTTFTPPSDEVYIYKLTSSANVLKFKGEDGNEGLLTICGHMTGDGTLSFSGSLTVTAINGIAYNLDPLTQYAILTGRSGGQTLRGGTASGENLIISSTANATKGKVGLSGDVTNIYVDEVNKTLNIGAPRTTSARHNIETGLYTKVGSTIRATSLPSVTAATGGDTVVDTGGYRVHTFLSNSNFIIPSGGPTDINVLVVAGGGGGGGGGAAWSFSSGGGAGGVILTTQSGLSPGTFPVVIGGGGAGGNSANQVNGTNGNDSTFNGLTAVGGGGGGSYNKNGSNGGSGGGGGYLNTSGGTGTASQGNTGGHGDATGNSGGGGGGAGGVGLAAVGNAGGNGGPGQVVSTAGISGTYGGGGAGDGSSAHATGGSGGGGSSPAGNGTANTGGGGSGGGTAGNGGSGIVIISYVYGVTPQSADLHENLADDGSVLSSFGPNGDIITNTAGVGIKIKEGTNACMGVATLSGGTVTVSTTKITSSSRVFLTTEGGTLTHVGTPYVSSRTAGTSFVITSTNALDVSDVGWLIMEPS